MGYQYTNKIGYFQPNLNNNITIKQSSTAIYYKDINIFIDYIQDIIIYKDKKIIKVNI